MELYRFLTFIILIHESISQHRRFYRKRQNHGRNHFGHSHRNHPQFINSHHNQQHEQFEEPIYSASFCPQIDFLRALDNRWYGSFNYNPVHGQKGIKIEIEFNESVIGFVNDFSHSTSVDNRLFVISDDSKMLKRGELLKFNFFVNFNELSALPVVLKVRVNNTQLCPDETVASECAAFEILNNERGNWEGILTVYGHQYNIGRKVDFLFDKDLIAFINDIGDSTSNDQKSFTVSNYKQMAQKANLVINFKVKFDEFKDVPKLKEIYVDNLPICLSDDDNINRSNLLSTVPPTLSQSRDNLTLGNLPFYLYPNVTAVPEKVFNENYECGLSVNSIIFRVDSEEIAENGQFPFHAAIFYSSDYRCAGSLLSKNAVLTAGHCVVDSEKEILPINNFHILFGTIDLQNLTGYESLRKVSKIIKHPNYYHNKVLKQDIAMVLVNGNLQFSDYIRPICLPENLPPIGERINNNMIVLGFGSTVESIEPSRYLHFGEMTIISREECTENIIFALLPEGTTFCAKYNNSILCPGDSGGGIIETINNKHYLRGIASITVTGSDGKCILENPVSFTDIKAFLPWIKENLNK